MKLYPIKSLPRYAVSEFGELYSTNYRNTGKTVSLKLAKDSEGYLQVNLFNELKIGKTYRVHRLVYETIKGSIPEGYVIDHIDGNPSNNNINNLQCISQSDNLLKAKRLGSRKPKQVYLKVSSSGAILGEYTYKDLEHAGLTPQQVRRCCKVPHYTYRGYHWRLKEEAE